MTYGAELPVDGGEKPAMAWNEAAELWQTLLRASEPDLDCGPSPVEVLRDHLAKVRGER